MTVEITTRYVTSVETLSEAWAFIMDHLDTVGESPSVHIHPIWRISMDSDDAVRVFEAVVEGMVEHG